MQMTGDRRLGCGSSPDRREPSDGFARDGSSPARPAPGHPNDAARKASTTGTRLRTRHAKDSSPRTRRAGEARWRSGRRKAQGAAPSSRPAGSVRRTPRPGAGLTRATCSRDPEPARPPKIREPHGRRSPGCRLRELHPPAARLRAGCVPEPGAVAEGTGGWRLPGLAAGVCGCVSRGPGRREERGPPEGLSSHDPCRRLLQPGAARRGAQLKRDGGSRLAWRRGGPLRPSAWTTVRLMAHRATADT
jgi:hypothetical protein